jgi:hypothetical protein
LAPAAWHETQIDAKPTGEVQEAFLKRFRSLLDPA